MTGIWGIRGVLGVVAGVVLWTVPPASATVVLMDEQRLEVSEEAHAHPVAELLYSERNDLTVTWVEAADGPDGSPSPGFVVEERGDAPLVPGPGCRLLGRRRVAFCAALLTSPNPTTALVLLGGLDDRLEIQIGPDRQATVYGDKGDDVIDAHASASKVVAFAGPGDDVVSTGPGADALIGEAGSDRLRSGAGNDSLDGDDVDTAFVKPPDGGDDDLDGGAGDDLFYNYVGADVMSGGAGFDTVSYGFQAGPVVVDLGASGPVNGGATDGHADVISGIEGLRGTHYADELSGDGADNVIEGYSGDDRITGGAGADRLFAHAGDDHVDSDDGVADTVDCGAGLDTLISDPLDVLTDC
jgi:hypothetical protein